MKFLLEVNLPVVPTEVMHSNLAYAITEMCQSWRTPIPADLQKFVKKHDPEAWSDWEQALLKAADTMSEELLNQWLDALRGHHFCRAELRAFVMKKFHPAEYAANYKDALS
jgi:hypothetical protein